MPRAIFPEVKAPERERIEIRNRRTTIRSNKRTTVSKQSKKLVRWKGRIFRENSFAHLISEDFKISSPLPQHPNCDEQHHAAK